MTQIADWLVQYQAVALAVSAISNLVMVIPMGLSLGLFDQRLNRAENAIARLTDRARSERFVEW